MAWRIGGGRSGLAILVTGLAVAAIGLEEGGRRWFGRAVPTGEAEWIWAPLATGFTEPVAFWAVRDFELDAVPEAASLSLLAEDEYVAHLNGRRVGSNRYVPGAAVDRYRVEGLLLPGGNRLAIELRSGHGAGGLLARLELDGAGTPPIVSDRRWRILRRHHPGLLAGWMPLPEVGEEGAEEPASWGRPPVGRWGLPEIVVERPLTTDVTTCETLPATSTAAAGSRRQVLDWGREVHGYLTLRLAPEVTGATAVGLLLVGDVPRRPLEDPESAVAVVPVPAQPVWTDSVPRRFRYASVAGLPPLLAAEVVAVDGSPAASGLPWPVTSSPAPLLGLEPPLHLTPAEQSVRRRLDGVEGP